MSIKLLFCLQLMSYFSLAQDSGSDSKALYLENSTTKSQIVLFEGDVIKIRANRSFKTLKGELQILNDSIVKINKTKVQLSDITSVKAPHNYDKGINQTLIGTGSIFVVLGAYGIYFVSQKKEEYTTAAFLTGTILSSTLTALGITIASVGIIRGRPKTYETTQWLLSVRTINTEPTDL